MFVQLNSEESETVEVHEDIEREVDPSLESTKTDEQATQEDQVSASQVSKGCKTLL